MNTATDTLNDQQSDAALDTGNSILLLAGAGTGKTNTLAHRVGHLLASGAAAPEEVLCLTFTNRACREMRERISRFAGEGADRVQVRTVHGFCAWLLRQTPQGRTDLNRDFAVCDQPDCLEAIREVVLEETGRAIGDFPAGILQRFIELVKDCRFGHPEYGNAEAAAHAFNRRRAEIERFCVDPQRRFDPKFFAFLAKYGASIVRCYDLKLARGNLLDFSDLLLRADALLSDPALSGLWGARYRYVHIDEAQDVSLAEYALVRKLCGAARVLLCGDFYQTIYQWRGSDPEGLIRRFRADFSPRTIEFLVNYRSRPALLAATNGFLRAAFSGAAPGGMPDGGAVTARAFETLSEEVAWIHRAIEELPVADYSRVAIITRSNRACLQVCELLKTCRLTARKPVRFLLADEFRLFKRAEVKDAIACLNLVANPRDGGSLSRVLTRLVKGVGAAAVEAVAAQHRSGLGVALTDFIDPRVREGDYFERLLSALDAGRVVVFDVESTGTDTESDGIIQLAAARVDAAGKVLGRFERFLRPGRPVGDSAKVHGFTDEFLAANGIDPKTALEGLLDFIGTDVVVGHNVDFDLAITARNLEKYNTNRIFDNIYYDTLDLSRRFLPKLDNHKLCTVAAALGASNDPTHNAMDDILATADVLVALADRFLRPRTEERRACYRKFLPKFAPAADKVSALTDTAAGLDAPELLARALDVFGLLEKYRDEPQKQANLLLFSDFVSDFADRSKPPRRQLADILEMTALSASELDRLADATNQVAVITAHQAKGCEFDHVFLPVLQDGVFPSYQAVRDQNIEEEKRVFYVSITRAREHLYLSWSRRTEHGPAKPSRFLALLGVQP